MFRVKLLASCVGLIIVIAGPVMAQDKAPSQDDAVRHRRDRSGSV